MPVHSITSSARASRVGGTVRPSAFAVREYAERAVSPRVISARTRSFNRPLQGTVEADETFIGGKEARSALAALAHLAWRKTLTGVTQGPMPFFWGVSKTV